MPPKPAMPASARALIAKALDQITTPGLRRILQAKRMNLGSAVVTRKGVC